LLRLVRRHLSRATAAVAEHRPGARAAPTLVCMCRSVVLQSMCEGFTVWNGVLGRRERERERAEDVSYDESRAAD
jgi:hypothetical protein